MEWEATMKKRMKEILYKTRKKVKKGGVLPWIDEGSLGVLNTKWNLKSFKDRSKQAKDNKSKGESKHTQESVYNPCDQEAEYRARCGMEVDEFLATQESEILLTPKQECTFTSQLYFNAVGCKKGYVYGLETASSMYYPKEIRSSVSRVPASVDRSKMLSRGVSGNSEVRDEDGSDDVPVRERSF